MIRSAFLAGLALLSPTCLPAEPGACRRDTCNQVFNLTSLSATRSYGLLLAAPDSGCKRVRYRVETAATAFIGHTPPLGPGESAVVRMGRGFAPGAHALTIAAEGCTTGPSVTRRVTFAKLSPDHGWRAAK